MKKTGHNAINKQATTSIVRAEATAPKSGKKAGSAVSSCTSVKVQAFRTEKAMKNNEDRIPQLAADAVKQARAITLSAGRSVVEVVDGKLVETLPDGSFKVIRLIASSTSVAPEKRFIRKAK